MDDNLKAQSPDGVTPEPTAPQPAILQPPTDGVWISKEEYVRLSSQAPAPAVGSGQSPSFAIQPEAVARGNTKDFWTYASAAAAVLIFVMLTIGGSSWVTVPAIVGVVIFAILAIKSLVSPKQVAYDIQPSQSAPEPIKTPSKAGKVVGLVLGGLVLVIVAPFALMIVFFFILLSSGAASGS